MTTLPAFRTAIAENSGLRRWISRAFILSIVVYLVVIAYLVMEAVTGASKWAPYGVNMPTFIGLIIASEVVVAATAVWIFKEDSGIWPPAVSQGWRAFRSGKRLAGLRQMAAGAWDVPIIDLRMRTSTAIFMGRMNRVAALAPLLYVLAASAGSGVPWGLRSSAIFDVVLTAGVWLFMELVMVRPDSAAPPLPLKASSTTVSTRTAASGRAKESVYEVRRLEHGDIPRILQIDTIKWREQAATRASIESRLAQYPQGQLVVDHLTMEHGEASRRSIVAWLTVMPIASDKVKTFGTWNEVSGGGTLSTCEPDGDTLIGVNLTSVTNGATYMVLGEMLASVVEWGKARLIGGARLNGFVAFNDHRTAEGRRAFAPGEYANLREIRGHRINELRIEQGLPALPDDQYVALVNAQRTRENQPLLDDRAAPDYVCSNLRGYLSIPGSYVVELIPGYFPDPASDNWGVVIAWDNPLPRALRRLPVLKGIIANRIRKEVRDEWEVRKATVREQARRRTPVQTVAVGQQEQDSRELAAVS
jgi:hypothetical protein